MPRFRPLTQRIVFTDLTGETLVRYEAVASNIEIHGDSFRSNCDSRVSTELRFTARLLFAWFGFCGAVGVVSEFVGIRCQWKFPKSSRLDDRCNAQWLLNASISQRVTGLIARE